MWWSKETPLCVLARKYHTDKTRTGDNQCSHNYTPYYDMLLSHRRSGESRVQRVLEIGCGWPGLMHSEYGAGGSLRMWAEYFPDAAIFGLDIRPDALVNEGRIKSFLCDQSSEKDLLAIAGRIGEGGFDLIVDDGSHIAEHQILTAQIFVPLMNPGALYIIEDVHEPYIGVVRNAGYPTACLEIPNPNVDDRFIIIRAGEQCVDVS